MKTKLFAQWFNSCAALSAASIIFFSLPNTWAKTVTAPSNLSASDVTTEPGSITNNTTGMIGLPASDSGAPRLKISYLGIMFGPGTDFSNSTQSTFNNQETMGLSSRPKFTVQTSENVEFGLETRFFTQFGTDDRKPDFTAVNENYRLGVNFKNVMKTDTVSFSFNPRVMLPTSPTAHNQDMKPSPELVGHFDFAPKDSRYSFTAGTIYRYFALGNNAKGADYTNAVTSAILPWLEAYYQMSPKVQLTLQYWPEWDAKARKGQMLKDVSQELDAGAVFSVGKSWQLNPMLSADLNGMSGEDPMKNMQLNLLLMGSIL